MSTISSNSSSFTASVNSSLEIFDTRSCCISSPNSKRTSPSSSVFNSENNNVLCLGGDDSSAWAISGAVILFISCLI